MLHGQTIFHSLSDIPSNQLNMQSCAPALTPYSSRPINLPSGAMTVPRALEYCIPVEIVHPQRRNSVERLEMTPPQPPLIPEGEHSPLMDPGYFPQSPGYGSNHAGDASDEGSIGLSTPSVSSGVPSPVPSPMDSERSPNNSAESSSASVVHSPCSTPPEILPIPDRQPLAPMPVRGRQNVHRSMLSLRRTLFK